MSIMSDSLIDEKTNLEALFKVLDKTFMTVRLSCDGKIIDANLSFLDLFQYKLDELYKESYWRLVNSSYADIQEIWTTVIGGEQWIGESCLITKNGDMKWLESTFIPVLQKDGEILHILSLHLDKTDQKYAEKWKRLACRNELTKLPNRRALISSIDTLICQADQNDMEFAVLFMDINQFKSVNDNYGHHIGDLLLIEVGKRMLQLPFLDGRLFHIGGDEFIILLDHNSNLENALKSIFALFDDGFKLDTHFLQVSVSIGISQYPNHSTNAQQLVNLADQAMYEAKATSRNEYRLYGTTTVLEN